MYKFAHESFESYLKNNGVKLVNNIENINYELNEQNIMKQIYIISDFGKIASNYTGIELKGFNNKTGMYVEKLKLKLKSMKKYVDDIKLKKNKTKTEEIILDTYSEKIKLARECIECIRKSDYLDILKRIMAKDEICILDTYFNNINRKKNIEVVNLGKCAIDLCEFDCICFLKRIKRKQKKLNFKKIINEYCKYNGLKNNSEYFIKAVLSYPYEYIKWSNEYKIKKKNLEEDTYAKKIIKAIRKDNINLL